MTPRLPLPVLGLATTGNPHSGQVSGKGIVKRENTRLDFTLDEDQQQIQDMMRKFAQNELRVIARECDEESKLPAELLDKVWEFGFCPNVVPEQYGGSMTESGEAAAKQCLIC